MLIKKSIYFFLFMLAFYSQLLFAADTVKIPILCYHNFNPTKPGSMNLNLKTLEAQLKWLKDNGFTVIPLKEAVAYLKDSRTTLPKKPVVITVDDGWQSAYTYFYPIIRKYNYPVTLFIYPETISAGKNAMTWDELRKLQATGLFDIQSHTYSHPNFKQMKRHLSAARYEKFVTKELVEAKKILEDKLHTQITLLAWPFGIYTPDLEQAAKNAGYEMAFSIDARKANRKDREMAVPRYMIIQAQSMKTFQSIVK